MSIRWRVKWLRLAVLALAASGFPAGSAHADRLGEFLFWDRMGSAAGSAASHYADYRREREKWSERIAAARAELERCGGCAGAQAELDKWQGVENRFQDVAGRLGASVGMPAAVADWLDIDVPLAAGRSEAERRQECAINPPGWAAQTTPECKGVVRQYISCLRDYEQENGMCSADVAQQTGGQCWQSGKLVEYCGAQDYAGLERELEAQELRRSDPSVPDYVDYGEQKWVIYGHPGPEFSLPMPPQDIVAAMFEEDGVREIRFLMNRPEDGPLRLAVVQNFFWTLVEPNSDCYTLDRPEDELSVRVCEDFSEARGRELRVLSCWYSSTSSHFVPDHLYWYGDRHEMVMPRVLMERSANHPMLRIGEPRTECPADRSAAEAESRERWERLVGMKVEQVPSSQPMRSAWVAEMVEKNRQMAMEENARNLAAFPIAGYYGWSAGRWAGNRSVNEAGANCLITAREDDEQNFDISCERRGPGFSAEARVEEEGLVVRWSDGRTMVYNPSTANISKKPTLAGLPPEGTGSGYVEMFFRNGTYHPEQLVEIAPGFPFEGRYALELEFEKQWLDLTCDVELDPSYRPAGFDVNCYTDDGTGYSSRALVRQQGEVFLAFDGFSPSLRIGARFVQGLKAPIDAAARGDGAAAILVGVAGEDLHARFTRIDASAPLAFGTPLEALDLKASYVESIRRGGIKTIEELAALSDDETRAMGFGWLPYRDAARSYLETAGQE